MQCPGMHENYNNVDGYIIMQKLPKDGAVGVVRINAISNGRKQAIQQSLHTFVTTSLLA